MTPTTIDTSRVVSMGIRSLAYTQRVSGGDSETTQIQPRRRPGFGVNGSIPPGIDRFPGSLLCAPPAEGRVKRTFELDHFGDLDQR